MSEHWFDELTRLAATGVSRRTALGWLGRRVAGLSMLSMVPPETSGALAWLAAQDDRCNLHRDTCGGPNRRFPCGPTMCCEAGAQCETSQTTRGRRTVTSYRCASPCTDGQGLCGGRCCDLGSSSCCGTGSVQTCCPSGHVCDATASTQCEPKCIPAGDVFSTETSTPSSEAPPDELANEIFEACDPPLCDRGEAWGYDECPTEGHRGDSSGQIWGFRLDDHCPKLKGGLEVLQTGTSTIQEEDPDTKQPIEIEINVNDSPSLDESALGPDWDKWYQDLIGKVAKHVYVPLYKGYRGDSRAYFSSCTLTVYRDDLRRSQVWVVHIDDEIHRRAQGDQFYRDRVIEHQQIVKNGFYLVKPLPFPKYSDGRPSKLTGVRYKFNFRHNIGTVGIQVAKPPVEPGRSGR